MSTIPESHCRAHLNEHGWLRVPGVVSAQELLVLQEALDAAAQELLDQGRETVLGLPLLFSATPDGGRRVARLAYASHYVPAVAQLVHDPRFDTFRRLVHPDAQLAERSRMGVIYNDLHGVPGGSSQMGWHTDGHKLLFRGRWPVENLQICLHLDDAPAAAGGVRVLPGTHNQGLGGLLFGKLLFVDKRPDVAELPLEASAGDVTIYDGRLWHRTDPGELPDSRRRQLWLKYLAEPEPERTETTPASLFLRAQGLDG